MSCPPRGDLGSDRIRTPTVNAVPEESAARAPGSTYCTAAHSMFLQDVCDDEPTVLAIVADPSGASLSDQDRAVYAFAAKVASDAVSVQQDDVDALRAHGLTDADVADVVFAAAARSFFARVLDGLGAELDVQTARAFAPDVLASMIVGRPVAGGEGGPPGPP